MLNIKKKTLNKKNMIKIKRKKTLKKYNKNKLNNKKIGGASDNDNFIFPSQNISTQLNTDASYIEVGVIHITESAAINAIKGFATGVANIFGSGGFDTSSYDKARNSALTKILNKINKQTQKICNLRMEIENNPQSSLFFVHLYGTLLQKRK
jgi:hypothetical protein